MPARRPDPSLFDDRTDAFAATRPPTAALDAPAFDQDLQRLGRRLQPSVHLGTSSWSFPGWQGIVYGGSHSEAQLARHGLAAYSQHPVLRAVGIDRTFYRALAPADYQRYAEQVPTPFRFLVKAPASVTDAVLRGERGAPEADNPFFLDPAVATDQFVVPAMQGLAQRAGPLVFQLSPLPQPGASGSAAAALIERLGAFLHALPRSVDGIAPLYAVELRNASLLTPRLVHTLRAAGVRLCVGIHASMPAAGRQSAALRAMDALAEEGDDWRMKGPLVARWSLHAGLRYAAARDRYAPFDRLLDADLATRGTLAHLIHVAIKSSQPSYVIVNNKAEGCAPLSCIELARAVIG